MKKILLVLIILLLTGCSAINEFDHVITKFENEEFRCIEGKNIWVYTVGGGDGKYAITSQIVGECDCDLIEENVQQYNCPNCSAVVDSDVTHCSNCGQMLIMPEDD